METASNTLLDRLVSRTGPANIGVEPTFQTEFEPGEEDVFPDTAGQTPKLLTPAPDSRAEPAMRQQRMPAVPREPSAMLAQPSEQTEKPIPDTRTPEPTPRVSIRTQILREPYPVEKTIDQPELKKVVTTYIEKPRSSDTGDEMQADQTARIAAAVEPNLAPEIVASAPAAAPRRNPSSNEVTVNVSIGRLEIRRAEKEKRADGRKGKPTQVGSLEQFLSARKSNGV